MICKLTTTDMERLWLTCTDTAHAHAQLALQEARLLFDEERRSHRELPKRWAGWLLKLAMAPFAPAVTSNVGFSAIPGADMSLPRRSNTDFAVKLARVAMDSGDAATVIALCRYYGEENEEFNLDRIINEMWQWLGHYAQQRGIVVGACDDEVQQTGAHAVAAQWATEGQQPYKGGIAALASGAIKGPAAAANGTGTGSAPAIPQELDTPKARRIWERVKAEGWVDEHLQLRNLPRKKAAILAKTMADVLMGRPQWKPFETLWGLKNLRMDYRQADINDYYPDWVKTVKRVVGPTE